MRVKMSASLGCYREKSVRKVPRAKTRCTEKPLLTWDKAVRIITMLFLPMAYWAPMLWDDCYSGWFFFFPPGKKWSRIRKNQSKQKYVAKCHGILSPSWTNSMTFSNIFLLSLELCRKPSSKALHFRRVRRLGRDKRKRMEKTGRRSEKDISLEYELLPIEINACREVIYLE